MALTQGHPEMPALPAPGLPPDRDNWIVDHRRARSAGRWSWSAPVPAEWRSICRLAAVFLSCRLCNLADGTRYAYRRKGEWK
jgi:hypothetical protein